MSSIFAVLVAMTLCTAGTMSSSSSSNSPPDVPHHDISLVDSFNRWFTDCSHHHRIVRVAAGFVNQTSSSSSADGGSGGGDYGNGMRRLGLMHRDHVSSCRGGDDSGSASTSTLSSSPLQTGEPYLSVNTSLSMSCRTLLLGSWPYAGSREAHNLQKAFRLTILEWIAVSHPEFEQVLPVLSGIDDEECVDDFSLHGGRWCTSVLCVVVLSRQRQERIHAVTTILQHLSPDEKDVILALWLMFEAHILGVDHSFYAPYLKLLPPTVSRISSAVFFSPRKAVALRGTAVHDRITLYRSKLIRQHTQLKNGRGGGASSFFQLLANRLPEEKVIPAMSFDLFQWAYGILWTRQVWWDGEAHLAPMHDLANCQEQVMVHTSSSVSSESEHNAMSAHLPPSTHKWAPHRTALDKTLSSSLHMDIVATRSGSPVPVQPEEEVVENYGESNSFYMLFHGFVLPMGMNSKDCGVVVMPSDMASVAAHHLLPPSTRKLLRDGGVLTDAPCLTLSTSSSSSILYRYIIPEAITATTTIDSSCVEESAGTSSSCGGDGDTLLPRDEEEKGGGGSSCDPPQGNVDGNKKNKNTHSIPISQSLNAFLSLLRAGGIITKAEQQQEKSMLKANHMAKLKEMADFAVSLERSRRSSLGSSSSSRSRSRSSDGDGDGDGDDDWKLNRDVLIAAKKIIKAQMKLMPTASSIAEMRSIDLGETAEVFSSISDADWREIEAEENGSWDMVSLYAKQQRQYLQSAYDVLSQLLRVILPSRGDREGRKG